MAQSGKDAILAAARRIAELDSDDDDTADDGDWANWGGIDWKNLDVDDEAEEHAARETSAESEARTAEALGIPLRLARWLARSTCRVAAGTAISPMRTRRPTCAP